MDIISFDDAIRATDDEDRSLLIGNGFSAKYFSYPTLLDKSGLGAGSALRNVFSAFGTVDFEAVVAAIESASLVEKGYGNNDRSTELSKDAQRVREALVNAVRATHPQHREDLSLSYESSAKFLGHFGKVFTLNYDLLLYWVILENGRLRDGFGKGSDIDQGKFRGPFYEDAYCDIYNLHGGLHLFQSAEGELIKALNVGEGVIATITSSIAERKQLPVYVAEGSSAAKMRKINSIGYLRHCYLQLLQNAATVFVYGHSADDNDAHIYRAIFSSPMKQLFFGVYEPTEEKVKRFRSQLAKYSELAGSRAEFQLYDAESAKVWG